MRIVLTVVAVELLKLPWLKLIGAVLLFWIAIKLLLPESEGEGGSKTGASMAAAVKTILIADLVMSLDNVIAVAAAAKGSLLLLIIGLGISIPLVVFGSTLLLGLMERFPIIITIGAALLGWVAGEMMISDPVVKGWIDANAAWLHYAGPAAGAAAVVVVGKLLAKRREEAPVILDDLAATIRSLRRRRVRRETQVTEAHMFNRILLAADASDNALRAVDYVIKLGGELGALHAIDIHLLECAAAGHRGRERVRGEGSVARPSPRPRREGARARPGPARRARRALHLPSSGGPPWQMITEYAKEKACDHIVMGRRGLGSFTGGYSARSPRRRCSSRSSRSCS